MPVEDLLEILEPLLDPPLQGGVLAREDGLEGLEPGARPVHVGLEVVEVGVRPGLLLTGDLALGDLVEKALGAVADLVDREGQLLHALDQRVAVGYEPVAELGALARGQRGVPVLRWPQVLLDAVPAGPGLPLLEV